ncbi:MAG: ABC-2 family transporter protein, partial [Mycobacteriales bacterium]
FIAYYAAAAVMRHLAGDHVVWEWDADLRSGDLSVRLLRPVHPFHQYAAGDLGYRAVSLALLLPVFVVAAWTVPNLNYRITPVRALGVAAAVAVAYLLSLVMASVFALLGFWSTQTTNVWMLWWGMGSFASGWLAPLELMPQWLRSAALVLPFRATLGFPVELLMGRLEGQQVAWGLANGMGWLAVFAAIYRVGWRRGVRRYQAVAG